MFARLRACLLLSALLPLLASPALAQTGPYLHDKPVTARHAMVVTVHHVATDAGIRILHEGGNAIDAAVAVGFTLEVVYPFAGNLGGGGFMLVHFANGKNTFIDYRERAPLAATPNMYLDKKGNVIPGASLFGYRAIGVPGSVAGLVYAEKKYGRLNLKKVMQPAIQLASHGFRLSAHGAALLRDRHRLADYPASYKKYQRDGNYYRPGDLFRQPQLAATLRKVAADPSDFYDGPMARHIAAFIQKGGGILTAKDLANYKVVERKPVYGTFHGDTIVSAPPPSSGGIVLIEALNILNGYHLKKLGDRTPAEMHLLIEAYRRAFMDRNAYLGDPAYVKMPIAAMLSQKYADAWRASILPYKATPSKDLHRPKGFLPPPPTMGQVIHESPDTTHYSIIDSQGNAVAVTTTLNGAFGSRVTVAGLGFLLNDEMDDFASKQGVPNMFGLIQGPANSIAPGKRPLSSMTPTIVLRHGKIRYVLGSPGGSRIITTVANIFLSSAVQGLNIQASVNAPRFHMQDLPDIVYLEPGFQPTTITSLHKRGYHVKIEPPWSDGECIAVDPENHQLKGGHDHRLGMGSAEGY